MIYLLDDDPAYLPDPHFGEPSGLVAIGGDLKPSRLIYAYEHGFFPWYAYKYCKDIEWYCPLQRFVIFPHEIHISHSMKQLLAKDLYTFTMNKAFTDVIRNCGKVDDRSKEDGAWLGPHIIKAYTRLHALGRASSVEVWDKDGKLVGGLYGIRIGHSFIGESMFSLIPNGSKLALIYLARTLEAEAAACGAAAGSETALPTATAANREATEAETATDTEVTASDNATTSANAATAGEAPPIRCLIDCQFETPHLKSMGGRHIPYELYMEILRE